MFLSSGGRGKCDERLENMIKGNYFLLDNVSYLGLITYSKLDTMRWRLLLPAYSCDFESMMTNLTDWREYVLWKNSLRERKPLKF